ncbi:MAG TPA: potassium channel family protein [Acidimicrobiales bacterium]|nr:potassium channel family protein [Acidimicrobiales bacterium]
MTVLDWTSVVAGVALALLVIVDVFLTIVHPDLEGRLAKGLQRETWRLAMALGRAWRSHRRGLMALAGPVMTVFTFAVWIGLFVLACALVLWPFLDSYRNEPELGRLTFFDALYYSGTTVTSLGYGDVTPLRGGLKVLAFFASATGFGLFTGIVAYLIELISGIDERNRFALRVHDETDGEERGAQLIIRSWRREDVQDLRERYESWATVARSVQDRLHRYAFASLFYRSKERIYDPEPALRVAAEAAIAGHLLVTDERWKRLAPAVEHLDMGITRLLGTIAEQYLGHEVTEAMASPSPSEADQRYVDAVRDDLRSGLGDAFEPAGGEEPALDLAFRCRTSLSRLDRITNWSEDCRFVPGWRE